MNKSVEFYKWHRFPPAIIQYASGVHRELMSATIHDAHHYANNRPELSHQPTQARVRDMRGFSSPERAQQFLNVHAVVYSLFNLQCHLVSAAFYWFRRARAFECWNEAVAA